MGTHPLSDPRVSVPAFAERVFGHLPRADQRRWAQAYLLGLLTTCGKKSVRRLAATVSDSPTTSQSLHQFVNASPWDWAPVRRELTRWVGQRMTPRAWVVDLAVLRKRGEHSCGVHRRFVPSTGRSVTCQVGVGAFLADHDEAVPVDWQLLLPGSWARDPERRRRTRIPDGVGARSLEQHALALVDALAGAGRAAPVPVVADLCATTSGANGLVPGLVQRGRDFVVAVPDDFMVVLGRPFGVQHRYGAAAGRGPVLRARSIFQLDAGCLSRIETVTPRSWQTRHVTVTASLVYLPGTRTEGPLPMRPHRLFTVRSGGDRRPAQLWLTNMTHTRTEEVLALTRLPSRTAQSVRHLESDFGLLDFEGRSYPGWHHHMTLASAAYAYRRLCGSGIPQEAVLAAA